MPDKFLEGLRKFYIPLHTIVVLEGILFIVVAFFIHRNGEKLFHRSQRNIFILLFLAAFFLTTQLSRPIWDIVPGFPFLQFPWRWVSITELSICFLVGYAYALEDGVPLRSIKLKKVIMYILIILFLASSALIVKSTIIPDALIRKIIRPEEIRNFIIPFEYTPIWVKDVRKISADKDYDRVSVISGTASFDISEWHAESRAINVRGASDVLMRIATFYYPGWEASIDGKKIPIKIEPETGAMLIDVPQGEHVLVVQFKETPIRYYAKFVSLGSLLIILAAGLFMRKKQKKY